ncbi:MAG: ureidoglycolate lyase [Candidatus Puniceispirillum sp. TMED245]|jgi:ureidoglycolate lyase|nr:MAG: ureidoglycolate lyase [Candidatus Puniceispirillum sp. TMED245]
MSPRALVMEPLTKAAFAPFGTVIERDGAEIRMINEGTTTRYHALSGVDVAAGGGTAILSIFAGTPRSVPIEISMMERHPIGSQAFMPLLDHDWLVVVAPTNGDDSAPDFNGLRCFHARGDQGVSYAPHVWHHPLLVRQPQDFLIADRAGPEGESDSANLQEHWEDSPVAVIEI